MGEKISVDLELMAKSRALFISSIIQELGSEFVLDGFVLSLLIDGNYNANWGPFNDYLWSYIRCFLEDRMQGENILAFTYLYPMEVSANDAKVYIHPDIESDIYPLYFKYLRMFINGEDTDGIIKDINRVQILEDETNTTLIKKLANGFSEYYREVTKNVVVIGGNYPRKYTIAQ